MNRWRAGIDRAVENSGQVARFGEGFVAYVVAVMGLGVAAEGEAARFSTVPVPTSSAIESQFQDGRHSTFRGFPLIPPRFASGLR